MAKQYELATAYVSILPSMKGMSKEIDKAGEEAKRKLGSALGNASRDAAKKLGAAFGKGGIIRDIGGSISKGVLGGMTSIGKSGSASLLKGLGNVGKSIGTMIFNGAKSAIGNLASSLKSGLKSAVSVGLAGIGTAVGAVAAQTLGGGLNRALDVTSAKAKLEAFGYEASEIDSIMKSVSGTVSGTRFTTPEALQTTNKLLASGIKPGAELEKILQQTVKLADMSGSEFGDMGTIVSQAYGSGVIQADELNQILDRGVGITAYLAKEMGVAQSEVKKMGSEGKISFQDLMNAVEAVDFDSTILASKDARLSFDNLRSVFSQYGEKLWTPITSNAAQFFLTLRNGFKALESNPIFVEFTNKIIQAIQIMVDKLMVWSDKFSEFISDDMNIQKFVDDFEDFRGSIKGFEPILLGIAAVLGSSILSRIPVLGSMLGGLTLPAGILIGVFGYLYKTFEEFGTLLSLIGDKATEFFKGLKQGFKNGETVDNSETFVGKIRDSLNKLIEFVTNFDSTELGAKIGGFMTSAMTGLQENLPRIVESIKGLISAIGGALDSDTGKIDGGNLIETITSIITLILDKAALMVPIISKIISTIGDLVTSEVVTTIISSIAWLISFLAQNQGMLTVLLGVMTAFFVNAKFIKPIESGIGIFDSIGKVLKGIAKNLGTVLTSFFQGLGAAGKVAVTNAPYILAIALAISGLILAFAGVAVLLEKMGFFTVVKDLVSFIIDEVSNLILKMQPIFEMILPMILEVFDILVNGIVSIVPIIIEAIVQLVEAVMVNINDFIVGIKDLIVTIAKWGLLAGANAIVLAGGLTLLAASLVALLAVGAGNTIVDGVGSLFGKDKSFIDEIISLTEALGKIGDQVNNLPTILSDLTVDFETVGTKWNNALFAGFQSTFDPQLNNIRNSIKTTMRDIQNDLTAKPLEIKFKQPVVPTISGMGGISGGNKNNVNNTNNVFNVQSVVNNDALDRLIRSAR